MFWWLYKIKHYFSIAKIEDTSHEYSLYRVTKLYPIALVSTWVPIIIIASLFEFGGAVDDNAFDIPSHASLCLSTQYGTMVGCLFVYNSSSLRRMWRDKIGISSPPKQSVDRNSSADPNRVLRTSLLLSPYLVSPASSVGTTHSWDGVGSGRPDAGAGSPGHMTASEDDSDEEVLMEQGKDDAHRERLSSVAVSVHGDGHL
jgi:hypothetical protein